MAYFYSLLPTSHEGSQVPVPSRRARRGRVVALTCGLLVAFFIAIKLPMALSGKITHFRPPTYEKLWDFERHLPQHDLRLTRTGRYVRFANQVRQKGWNNVVNEMYVCQPSWRPWRCSSDALF